MSVSEGLPTICIAADDFTRTSETFVQRHLQLLNGGNTVGLARRASETGDKPVLHWPRRALAARLARLGVPGLRDSFPAQLEGFCRHQGVGFLLAEFGTVGVDLYAAAGAIGLPMFCYFRGYDASRRLASLRYRRRLSAMFDRIDGIVAVSGFLLERLAGHGLVHRNAYVIPSGVDVELFRPGVKDSHLAVMVGRLVEKKAPLTVVRAFARAAADRPGLRLEVIGDGPLAPKLRALVTELGLIGRVVLHGQRDHAFIRERMAAGSIYLQHSVTTPGGETEGAPTALQEAMAAGMAVVATRHAGIPELVTEGVTGLLVDEHDEAGFADALGQLAVSDQLRSSLMHNARKMAEGSFDYRIQYARLERAIGEAIERRTAPTAATGTS